MMGVFSKKGERIKGNLTSYLPHTEDKSSEEKKKSFNNFNKRKKN